MVRAIRQGRRLFIAELPAISIGLSKFADRRRATSLAATPARMTPADQTFCRAPAAISVLILAACVRERLALAGVRPTRSASWRAGELASWRGSAAQLPVSRVQFEFHS